MKSYLSSLTTEERVNKTLFGKFVPEFGYPEDVASVLQLVRDLWNLRIPKHKKDKSYWIESARRIMDAGGKHHEDVIREVRKDFEEYMASHQGHAPYTVEGPGSLVKMVRAKDAQMGDKSVRPEGSKEWVERNFPDWLGE